MMKPKSLFDAATMRGRVVRQGEIVGIIMDGGGAVVVHMQEFVAAQKWASSKPFSGNALTDRARFLDQFTSLVARPHSVQPTRGNDRQLDRLVRQMRTAGYDITEWQIPPEMKDPAYWRPTVDDPKKKKDDEPSGGSGDA
ncbi:MAG TPA: hypothetical protein VJM11_12810 [Nevskiaceae bacterium]|nr:hypothetical protein [Nevskiaceae bacterium]